MSRSRVFVLVCLFLLSLRLHGQILPKEGSVLNYRIVGFSFPPSKGEKKFRLQIAACNCNSEDSFARYTLNSFEVNSNEVVTEVPSFGTQYTWRIVNAGGAKTGPSVFHHFSTGYCKEIDSNNFRVNIIKPAERFKDAYFFLDNSRSLYDMNGRPVWYLPDSGEFKDLPLDLKLSPAGTLTFILHNNAYETDFAGKILWKAPNTGLVSGEDDEHYHHQFSRLANGHYLAMGTKTGYVLHNVPSAPGADFVIDDGRSAKLVFDTAYRPFTFGTIIEFDAKGKIIWSWKLSDYFKFSDLSYFRREGKPVDFDFRENGFYFDETKKVIYLSLKTCSRILKIEYPGGKVSETYGEVFKPGIPDKKNGLFYGQHACNISSNGDLYLYNNNMRDSSCMPEVLVLHEPATNKDTLKKTWQYNCTCDDIAYGREGWPTLAVGGNVNEMPDHSFFVTMGGTCSKIFIVDRDKQVTWSANPVKWEAPVKKWKPMVQYRGSMIFRHEDLEALVWAAERR